MTARVVARRAGLAPVHLVRPVAVAEPQLLVRLGVPLQRALGAVGLEPDPVLAAGADLRDDERAAPAVVEPQQDVREILARQLALDALDVVAPARERLDRPGRDAPHGMHGREVAEHARDPLARHERDEVEPVRADVGDRAQRAALLGVEPPVPVGVLQQPVLDVAAVDVEHAAELAAAHPVARRAALPVEADVVVRAVHEAALARPAARAPPSPAR